MKLSKIDRVHLINQYRILAALYENEADHYNELVTILNNGYEIFYSNIDEWIYDGMAEEKGRFVLKILDLYRAIEDVKRSSKVSELHDHPFSFFKGFDGNHETEYMGFARFLINEQRKFAEQRQYLGKNDDLNSHMTMKDKYKKMLNKASAIDDIWNMNVEQTLEILNA